MVSAVRAIQVAGDVVGVIVGVIVGATVVHPVGFYTVLTMSQHFFKR